MDAKVIWKDKLSFTGTANTGFSLPLGADPLAGGDNDGFRPMELFLVGLAGCTAMDVISILRKKQQDVRTFEVLVHAERAEIHPKVFTDITIEYVIAGENINEEAVQRAVELSTNKYCPAQSMLGKVVPIKQKVTIQEF
jgi:putative redox protein